MPRPLRQAVDLTAYPDLVVIYLGFHVSSFTGLKSILGIGPGLRDVQIDKPDGLLAHEPMFYSVRHFGFRQYWRDLESLEAYTKAPQHAAWWRKFGKEASGGGFWHEVYCLRGGMEAVYYDTPGLGFGSFATVVPPEGEMRNARSRLAQSLGTR